MQSKVINGFEIKRLLGRGGMAEVWYAENEIGKPAAVKILNEALSGNPQIVERFHNEALVMVKLNHPNIRQVYGYGYIGNRHCIVMEYLEGGDLEAIMKSGRRFTDEELRRWWNQTVDALNYTHAMNIVHRDIKPSNLFLDNLGNIKLLDYGIAKVRESISLTQTGTMMGTLMYMSPEQVDDAKHLGPKSDAYSLAVTFVNLLTGRMPYDSTSLSDFKIRESIVYKPLDLSGVPIAWQIFLAPYLEKNSEDRPALRHFEKVVDVPSAEVSTSEPKTVMRNPTRAETPLHKEPPIRNIHSELDPLSPKPKEKPKGKIGLWIGLGTAAAVVAIVLAVLFMRSDVDVDGSIYGHDYVDLGLPSGTLWATCNVGASKPEDYGNYYAWGETQTKSIYSWDTYKYANGSSKKLTKYCNKSDYGNNGFTDNLSTLQSSDDPATAWGDGWYMPTKEQWYELQENTTEKWTMHNGVKGSLYTSKKNEKSLFLPAAGYRFENSFYLAGRYGYYWSSSLNTGSPNYAWYFSGNGMYRNNRNLGHSVRAVRSSR